MLRAGFALVSLSVVGCARSPETVVNFAAPAAPSTWEVREPAGARLCSLPCTVGLDAHDSVVLAARDGTQFVVQQDSLGPGTFSGAVRVRYEQRPAAAAVEAFSGALMSAGATLLAARREDRLAAGLVLSGIGTLGLIATSAWTGTPREELWLQRTAGP